MLKMLTLRYNGKMEKQQTEAVPQVFVRPGIEVFFLQTHIALIVVAWKSLSPGILLWTMSAYVCECTQLFFSG